MKKLKKHLIFAFFCIIFNAAFLSCHAETKLIPGEVSYEFSDNIQSLEDRLQSETQINSLGVIDSSSDIEAIEPDKKKARKALRKHRRAMKRQARKEQSQPKRYTSVYKLSSGNNLTTTSVPGKNTLTFYSNKSKREIKNKLINLNEYVKFIPYYDVFIDQELAEEKLEEVAELMKKHPNLKASLVGTASWHKRQRFQVNPDGSKSPLVFGKGKDVYEQELIVENHEDFEWHLEQAGIPKRETVRVGELIGSRAVAIRKVLISKGIAPERLGVVYGQFIHYQ